MCIVRFHSGDHINQALYVKEDLRVLDDVITLIFRIETRKSVSWNSFFFFVFVRDEIVSEIFKVLFDNVLS